MPACVREDVVNDEIVTGSYSTEVLDVTGEEYGRLYFVARSKTRRVGDAEG